MKSILLNISFVGKIWSLIRKKRIIKSQNEVSSFWRFWIKKYREGEVVKNTFFSHQVLPEKVIWQYWGQGIDDSNVPEVVRLCFDSVERYKEDYTIIRLDDATVKDYIDLPDYVWDKYDQGIITKTFLSDIIRLALLYTYGGVWLDATILLTGPLEYKYENQDFFMYQRCPNSPYKSFWENSYAYYWGWDERFKVRVLNSIFFAKKGNEEVYVMLNLLLHYWKVENNASNYFMFQILYEELFEDYLSDKRCIIVDDTYPHILQTRFNGSGHNIYSESDALNNTVTHKMSYFDDFGLSNLRNFLKKSSLS